MAPRSQFPEDDDPYEKAGPPSELKLLGPWDLKTPRGEDRAAFILELPHTELVARWVSFYEAGNYLGLRQQVMHAMFDEGEEGDAARLLLKKSSVRGPIRSIMAILWMCFLGVAVYVYCTTPR